MARALMPSHGVDIARPDLLEAKKRRRLMGALALGFALGRHSPAGRGPADGEGSLSITRITSSGNVTEAALSPDGRFVSYVDSEQGEQSLWLRQLATGQTLRLVPNRRAFYWGHTFTRDGNAIVFGLKSPEDLVGAFYSISTLGGAPRRLGAAIDSAPAFSPDGGRMAWVRAGHPTPEESALVIAKADASEERVLAAIALPERLAPIFFTAPSWSPDGRRVARDEPRRRDPEQPQQDRFHAGGALPQHHAGGPRERLAPAARRPRGAAGDRLRGPHPGRLRPLARREVPRLQPRAAHPRRDARPRLPVGERTGGSGTSRRSPDLTDPCLIRMSELHPHHSVINVDARD
jgi:hypothetical protein